MPNNPNVIYLPPGVVMPAAPAQTATAIDADDHNPGNDTFVIPGEHISARWDLMYYFEVLTAEGSGWFYPDPAAATPYFVVPTR